MDSTEEMTLEEKLKCSLSYDPDTGEIKWKERFNKSNALSSPKPDGYLRGCFYGKHLRAHRVAWLLYYGSWPNGHIDHVNGVRYDNRIENLRDVSPAENQRNQKLNSRNTTGFCGVGLYKPNGKYQAKYTRNGKTISLGYFHTIEDAVMARQRADEEVGFHPNHGRR